jgi:uncharacterized protein
VDLLGGRAALRTLHPFMAAEWSGFSLTAALQHGLVPLAVTSADPRDVLRAYVGLYLEQEVKAEGLARNLGDFARFLEAVSFSHGQVLNLSAVAREAGAHRRTVQGFLDVLEDLLLPFRLDVFTRRAKRRTAVHPKFYLFDAGVFRSLRPQGPLDRPAEVDGGALEGLVAQHSGPGSPTHGVTRTCTPGGPGGGWRSTSSSTVATPSTPSRSRTPPRCDLRISGV